MTATRVSALLGIASGVALLGATVAPLGESAASAPRGSRLGTELVENGSFERLKRGWSVAPRKRARLRVVHSGTSGVHAAAVAARKPGRVVVDDSGRTVGRAVPGERYRAAVSVQSSRRVRGALVVRHLRVTASGQRQVAVSRRAFVSRRGWQTLRLDLRVARGATALDVRVVARLPKRGRTIRLDGVSLRRWVAVPPGPHRPTPTPPTPSPTTPSPTTPTLPPTTAPPTPTGPSLTNGCEYSARGLPECGTYIGLAVGANSVPDEFEEDAGQPLGVHRTFWQANQVDRAVAMAARDVADGSIPWLSFKLPHSWPEMAAGAGDAWARDLATRLAQLDGPAWVAFHHEPEKDGDISQWTAIQERLGPIVRTTAPNVGFSVILTGFHQVFGETQTYGLDKIWPRTTVDVAGFDVYNRYGVPGSNTAAPADLTTQYFRPLGAWMNARKIAWGVAETGYTHQTAVERPHWLLDTYHGLTANGGIVMSYFDSRPASATGDWLLTDPVRGDQFLDILRGSPHIPVP